MQKVLHGTLAYVCKCNDALIQGASSGQKTFQVSNAVYMYSKMLKFRHGNLEVPLDFHGLGENLLKELGRGQLSAYVCKILLKSNSPN